MKNAMRKNAWALLVTLTMLRSAAHAVEAPSPALQAFLDSRTALMERSSRDEDWVQTLTTAGDVLVRLPGNPMALKWIGLSLAKLGHTRLALQVLSSVERSKLEGPFRTTVDELARAFARLEVRISGLPSDPRGRATIVAPFEKYLAGEAAKLEARTAAKVKLSEESKGQIERLLRDLAGAGLLREQARYVVDASGESATFVFAAFPAPATLALTVKGEAINLEDLDLRASVEGGFPLRLSLETVTLPSIAFEHLPDGEVVEVDGLRVRPGDTGQARVFLDVGPHLVRRSRGGLSWDTPVVLGSRQVHTFSFEPTWARVAIRGLGNGDEIRRGGRSLKIEDGSIAVPPGKHVLTHHHAGQEFEISLAVVSGQIAEIVLPARVTIPTDLSRCVA